MSWASRDLGRLERRVGEAYDRVVRCRRLIQKLRDRGDEAQLPAAEELLKILQQELDDLRSHQQIILGELAREESAQTRWRWR
ncbi:MAG TPA: hypothetical protein VLV76_02650 [Candidatus Acidoferrum sp.]|nr:hypothetical protein [Candidatus Acidoferrum sp.]